MKKKTFSKLLAMVLATSMLVACGQTKQPANTGESKEETKVSSESKTTSEEEKVVVSTDPLELTVWCTQGTDYVWQDVPDNIPEQWLKDKTGVFVENIYGNGGGQWDTMLTKLVAGDNLPDIIWCAAGQGAAHTQQVNKLGKLLSFTEETLQTYAPNVWAKVPAELWDPFRNEDGDIIGFPFMFHTDYLETVHADYTADEIQNFMDIKGSVSNGMVVTVSVRDDILKMIYPEARSYDELMELLAEKNRPIGDEILADVPIHTTQEYIDFMYAIRDLNLVEDGNKIYTYGLAGDGNDNWESFCYLGAAMYGANNQQYTGSWNTETNRIHVPLAGDLVKQMAKTQNQMVLDQVIDPESLVHTNAQFIEKVLQGRYAMCDASRVNTDYAALNKQLEEAGYDFGYRPLYVLLDETATGYGAVKNTTPAQHGICLTDSLTEEEALQVLSWIDLQFTEEFEEIYNWGTPEDGLYVDNSDGTRTFVDDAFNKYFIQNDSSALDVSETRGLQGRGTKLFVTPMQYSKWTPDVYNKQLILTARTNSGFKFASDSPVVARVETVPPCWAYSSVFAQVDELVTYWARREEWETAAKKAIAAGEGEFETKWTEMLEVLNGIVDVKTLEDAMTEAVAEQWEEIQKTR